ncbi:glycosyltransferase [Geovibrio thiophilus]|uniref:Glycosyltransferase n=2 Tax=Geovibrio thiophilus TaxID=139438 RepID=A0A3R5UWL2_9BACT|nr:glycosyltransferase [Geovibrio thiophilus]
MNPEISVVIPFYNEAENINTVCAELRSVLESSVKRRWETVLVNDGSTDGTDDEINKWTADPRFRAVHLHRNMGQSAALFAGFSAAEGEYIFTLDGDGQNDPADIPLLLEKMLELGVDMMCGVRAKRNDNIIRRFSSRLANRLRSRILGDSISDVGCSSRGFRRECLDSFRFFRNAHRFFPALVQIAGFTVAEMPVRHRHRNKGVSKYGAGINSRLWAGIADLFGVYWMKKRYISVSCYEYGKNQESIQRVPMASGE